MSGGITVFLSLILTCICALTAGLFESARLAGCGWYMQLALDSAVDSLMSCYHQDVWEKYRIFVLECSDQELLEAELRPYFQSYMDAAPFYSSDNTVPEVKSTSLITEGEGRYFEKQVLDYMKLGIWNTETDPSVIAETAGDFLEAESFQGVAEICQSGGREVLGLEETAAGIGACLERQEKYLESAESALADGDGGTFFREANRLIEEIKRIPALTDEYDRQAALLEKEMERAQTRFSEESRNLKADSAALLTEEMDCYYSYISADGERRQEILKAKEEAAENEKVIERAIRRAEEIQEYIDSREDEEDEDEEDEAALWRPVLDITRLFRHNKEFRSQGIKDREKTGVLEGLSRLAGTDLLSVCVPNGTDISDAIVRNEDFPSRISMGDDNGIFPAENLLESGINRVLFNEYAAHYFTRFGMETDAVFCYEQEYLLCGMNSDRDNLKNVVNRLIAVREAMNLMVLLTDAQKREEARILALAITGAAGFSPLSSVVAFFIMTVWAFAEAVEDVRTLLDGGKVPLIKRADEWKISLASLAETGAGVWDREKDRNSPGRGMDYQQWLKAFFLITPKNQLCYRMMDMIQKNISVSQKGFKMNNCLFRVEAEVTGGGAFIPVNREARKEY